jgi:MSHA biogenesis protein MshQ
VSNSCDSFTYLSQPELGIAYTLSAINAAGDTASNYDEGLGYPVGSIDYVAELGNNGINVASRLSVTTALWQAGEYNLIDTAAMLSRGADREVPLLDLSLGFTVDDIDNILLSNLTMNAASAEDCEIAGNCDAAELGTASFYYGRVSLADAYGPETAALPVAFYTEYWNGQKFITHLLDDCSALPRSAISFNNSAIESTADLSVNLTGGITTGQFSSISSSDVMFTGGDAGFYFSAPGENITVDSFAVDVDLSDIDWLRFDWNQDGNDSNDTQLPTATMRFKSYRGHDRILYWRHQ